TGSARTRYRRAATPASAPQEPRIERHHGKTIENLWQILRGNRLSNRVFRSYDDILDHCCHAWNRLIDQPWPIMNIGLRDWAHGF
ncbi:hypothetical protein ACFQX4_27795, partial [Roseomonas sp. GCM10028921]